MQTRPVVINAESKPAIGSRCRYSYPSSALLFRNAMFDGVFDDWLQNQAGNLSGKELFGNVHAKLQALRKPHFLNFQILLQELDFFSQRDLVPIGSVPDFPQK